MCETCGCGVAADHEHNHAGEARRLEIQKNILSRNDAFALENRRRLEAQGAVGLNLMLGYTGLVSLGHMAFAGIGGYTAAILMVDLGLSFWLALPIAVAAAGITGALIGIPCLRLRTPGVDQGWRAAAVRAARRPKKMPSPSERPLL